MMKNYYYILLLIAVLTMAAATSCKKKNNEPPYSFTVGLLVDAAGLNDRSFNQATLEGIQHGAQQLPLYYETKVGQSDSAYAAIIQYFIDQKFDLVVAPGYLVAPSMVTAAKQNQATDFLLLDFAPDTLTPNLVCGVFDVDQDSFVCGFLAAYWALVKDPQGPVAGYVGGPPVTVINQILVSYMARIDYFNKTYQKSVQPMGAHTANFTDSIQGGHLADSIINAGAEVIFAFAGIAGNGALLQTKASGKWGIGMDSDQYLTYPEVQDILLTSCLKNLNNIVYLQLVNYYHDEFPGGTVIHGDLSNGE
ncbi:MAG: BMP family ABC transporter substrate-binding protein [bacterium]